MAQTTMSVLDALGPLVDEQTRRQFVEMDRRNGFLPRSATILVQVRYRPASASSELGYWPAEGEVLEVEAYDTRIRNMLRDPDSYRLIDVIPRNTPLYTHQPTGRQFASAADLAKYAADYDNQRGGERYRKLYETVLPELVPTASASGSDTITAPPPASVQESTSPLGPQQQRRKSSKAYEPTAYKQKEVFEKDVRDVYCNFCNEHGERPDKEYVAAHLPIPISVKTMNRYHDYWHLMYPPQP